jgi:FecR-like protein/putative zinc finger protein
MTPSDGNPMDPKLEQAMSEIRDEQVDPAVIEAAAARVWPKIAAQASELHGTHIRDCAGFQALIPEYRAGQLPPARATLLKDHLNACVACRRVYEGRVISMPVAAAPSRVSVRYRWAVAAAVVAAAGLALWLETDPFGRPTGRAIVQAVNGSLYELSAAGIRPLAAGQELPDNVEIRTAKDSSAMLELEDGSVVEMRERSGFSASQSAPDLTLQLNRGSIIVQAAKRRKGHLFVATADCRVAVTGTVFSVSSGVKGSRVAVIEGEVRVSQNNEEKVLRPGDQSVSSASLEPLSVKDEISWSRNRDQLSKQLEKLTRNLQQIPLPGPRYTSKLLGRLPASTTFYASIPNLAAYLRDAQAVFTRTVAESAELQTLLPGKTSHVQPILEKVRAGSEYLGDEIVIAGFASASGNIRGPVFLAEMKRDGFPEFLKKEAGLKVETRAGLAAFGPHADAVAELASSIDSPSGTFQGTPFHARIADAYRGGAGFLICGDLSRVGGGPAGIRYFIAEQKEGRQQTELRATVGFEGQRTGIAAWLDDPAPMGSLDYISPEATLVTAFVVKDPAVIVDQLVGVAKPILRPGEEQTGVEAAQDLKHSLGGEFSLSLDGPLVPVPSWKLVTEVYDPARMQASLQKLIDSYNQKSINRGNKPLRTSQETVEGRTYYMIAGGDPNPLTEAHYTFADGYLIAGPTRAGVSRALQVKTTRTSITHAAQFVSMQPRDHYTSFSALVYQNLGSTLAPIVGLLGGFAPPGRDGHNPLAGLTSMKPTLVAAYGEPDRITVAGSGDVFSAGMTNLISGDLSRVVGSVVPLRR